MKLKSILLGAALSLFTLPALAEIVIDAPYARSSSPSAQVGAAFMVIKNTGDEDDRLISASTEAARRVELHTHVMTDGIAKMMEVPEGFVIPANGETLLERGGYHVMMMGLTAPFVQDETITINLTFEKAGVVALEVPIDSQRMGGGMDMGNMNHGGMNMGNGAQPMSGMSNN